MRYILDTHVALWFFNEPEKLSKTALNIVRNQTIEKRVSIASAWELAIKIGIGKLMFEGGVSEFFRIVEKTDLDCLQLQPNTLNVWKLFRSTTETHLTGLLSPRQ